MILHPVKMRAVLQQISSMQNGKLNKYRPKPLYSLKLNLELVLDPDQTAVNYAKISQNISTLLSLNVPSYLHLDIQISSIHQKW